MKRSTLVGEGPHPTATAGARESRFDSQTHFLIDSHLAGEGLAAVVRVRHPHAPVSLAATLWVGMPYDIYVAEVIGGHRSASIEPSRKLHDVALGLKGCARVVEP